MNPMIPSISAMNYHSPPLTPITPIGLSTSTSSSSLVSSSGGNSNKRQLERMRKSCNNCIHAKVKCTGERPCARCIQHKCEDSCGDVIRKSRKRQRTTSLTDYDPDFRPSPSITTRANTPSPPLMTTSSSTVDSFNSPKSSDQDDKNNSNNELNYEFGDILQPPTEIPASMESEVTLEFMRNWLMDPQQDFAKFLVDRGNLPPSTSLSQLDMLFQSPPFSSSNSISTNNINIHNINTNNNGSNTNNSNSSNNVQTSNQNHQNLSGNNALVSSSELKSSGTSGRIVIHVPTEKSLPPNLDKLIHAWHNTYAVLERVEVKNAPIHVSCISPGIPFENPLPRAIFTKNGPCVSDCNDQFAQYLGFKDKSEFLNFKQDITLEDICLPPFVTTARKSYEYWMSKNLPVFERLCVFRKKDGSALYTTFHAENFKDHVVYSLVERFNQRPMCLFANWLRKHIANVIVQGCQRSHCQCKISVD